MKLFFRKYGKGPPLVILHGLYGSGDNWTSIAKILSDTFTVYLPDQRNHGQTGHNVIHDYDSMRNDLFEMVTDLKLNKFFLAGHSMGGKTAISFSLKWPEMIYGLLIADISPFEDGMKDHIAYNQHLNILNAILSIDLAKIKSRKEAESLLNDKITSEKVRNFILKNIQRTADNKFIWKINAPVLLDNLENIMKGIDIKSIINQPITGFPMIILKGEESDYFKDSDLVVIQKIYPAAELIKIKNAGHWIHADRPEEVIYNLRKLLGDN